ncbi:hypothetical protein [Deinococcus sp.]|uniref:hypothetical protein n=1 Tax=Deinococcus sp. TaxID=47478 RepID=UPI003C7A3F06
MSGFTLPDTLPVVADVEALPDVCAVLTLEDGSRVTVGPDDRPSLTPPSPEDVGLLIGWNAGPDASSLYRVPAALAGRAAWATGCRPHTAPLLLEVELTPDAVTFTALQNGYCLCTLTAPRGALVRLGIPVPRVLGQPVRLTVSDQQEGEAAGQDAEQTRVFFFEVYPETPEGAACLEALGLSERVGLPDGEE